VVAAKVVLWAVHKDAGVAVMEEDQGEENPQKPNPKRKLVLVESLEGGQSLGLKVRGESKRATFSQT